MIIELFGGPLDGQVVEVEMAMDYIEVLTTHEQYKIEICQRHPSVATGHFTGTGGNE